MPYLSLLSIGVGAVIGAGVSLFALPLRRRPLRGKAAADAGPEGAVFLLEGEDILHGTGPAWKILENATGTGTWADIHCALHRRFPDLPATLPKSSCRIPAGDGSGAELILDREGRLTRLTVDGPAAGPAELHQLFVQHDELELLRTALAAAPHPIWQCDAAGTVLWHNPAYDRLCTRIDHHDPAAPLFDLVLPLTDEPARLRTSVGDPANLAWFEVCSVQAGETWMNYAADIDAVMRAETAQRNFVQTLTKTFAHLPIGLAIFDRDQRLALFNPALIDLTNLPPDLLSSRPNLLSFFDSMRENRMMPEPKNYAGWREQIADLVAAATDDRYCETWSLPSGLTYKITGRPHPDGAIAFLLEDISAEITLTRRFRSELELNQSVLDSIDDAVAVFSPLGVLTFCNAAYRALWQTDPEATLSDVTVIDATRQWQSACKASPIWGDIREFVLTLRERAPWDATLETGTDEELICHVEPASGGSTIVRFTRAGVSHNVPQPPRSQHADA